MIYRLTEEQSTEYYNNICEVLDFQKEIGEKASFIMMNWYGTYQKNRKWYWRDYSSAKFYAKIGNAEGFELKFRDGYFSILPRLLSGWVNKVKIKKLHNLTGIDIEELERDANVVIAAMRLSFVYGSFYELKNVKENLDKYCTVPYTLNEEDLRNVRNVEGILEFIGVLKTQY